MIQKFIRLERFSFEKCFFAHRLDRFAFHKVYLGLWVVSCRFVAFEKRRLLHDLATCISQHQYSSFSYLQMPRPYRMLAILKYLLHFKTTNYSNLYPASDTKKKTIVFKTYVDFRFIKIYFHHNSWSAFSLHWKCSPFQFVAGGCKMLLLESKRK